MATLRRPSALFVCDLQERFAHVVANFPDIVRSARLMVDVCRTMRIPIVVTEQNPERLGKTVDDLGPLDNAAIKVNKMQFSMVTPQVSAWLRENHVKDVVLVGIETHVCVHQSALDLLGIGVTVHVVCDAVGSQRPMDMDVALQQMARDGVRLTTSEAIAFRLLGTADDLNFKNVSALLKARHAQR
ncbi:unnamed protein product (mitochondrion) [Plasmodiophora brassicae]|uniref:Isochorismatase-like domain-containing protein n=1 Tax=Plasmodiophora brassicae TaxID=37360 RepID=A0A0G4IUM6_PLABS|nr:hypothetical protein PBRA_006948 [Plasmodiophora brassicae]SPR00546.1 unnamed protein product [Plasmodiophora brassicae]